MCDPDCLAKTGQVWTILSFATSTVLFVVGIGVKGAYLHAMTFGDIIVATGETLIATAALLAFLCIFLCYGFRNFNKFCLLVDMVILLILFLTQLLAGSTFLDAIESDPVQDETYKLGCDQGWTNLTDCKEGYLSDRLRRNLQKTWMRMEEESLGESEEFFDAELGIPKPVKETLDMAVDLQAGEMGFGTCCGLLPPHRCDVNLSINNECGLYPGWYANTPFCAFDRNGRNTLDPNYDGGRIAVGCPFDHPIGPCANSFPYVYEKSVGCLTVLHKWAKSGMRPAAYLFMGTLVFQIFAGILACCLCYKRKYHDVLPTKYVQSQGGIVLKTKQDKKKGGAHY